MKSLDTNTNGIVGFDIDQYGESLSKIKEQYIRAPRQIIFDNPESEDRFKTFYDDYLEIARYYHRYKSGTKYLLNDHVHKRTVKRNGKINIENVESEKGACLQFKKIAKLINKQARFLFGAEPDININFKMDLGEEDNALVDALNVTKEMINNIIKMTDFMSKLFVASKDCMIGKRVACVINFNQDSGVTVDFLPAFNFVYEYDDNEQDKLKYFSFFRPLTVAMPSGDTCLYVKKTYRIMKIDDPDGTGEMLERCWVHEQVFDEDGKDVTELYEQFNNETLFSGITDLDFIPAQVIINNGLLCDVFGVSDVEELQDEESWFNALACLDINALRKSMHPMKYTVDMDSSTTDKMTNQPGGYADLVSDRKDPSSKAPSIGLLESSMNFNQPLNDILQTIDKEMHDTVDVPNINLETMSGVLTSGKALKALYWGLITRCDEKMKVWSPAISKIMAMILEGCYTYPEYAQRYLGTKQFPMRIEYEFEVVRNNPLPEDEEEEKASDMLEVNNKLMSRKAYMMKWYNFNDAQANAELLQIAIEQNILEDLAVPVDSLRDNDLYKELEEGSVTQDTSETQTLADEI